MLPMVRAQKPVLCSVPLLTVSAAVSPEAIAVLLVMVGMPDLLQCKNLRDTSITPTGPGQQSVFCRSPARGMRNLAVNTVNIQIVRRKYVSDVFLDSHLRADFHDPSGRNLEEVGGVAGRTRQVNKQVILPGRHAGGRRRLERAPRQEERRRHDVELPAVFAGDGQ